MSEFLLGFCTAEDFVCNISTMIDLLVYNIARFGYIDDHKNNKTAVLGRIIWGPLPVFYLPVYAFIYHKSMIVRNKPNENLKFLLK